MSIIASLAGWGPWGVWDGSWPLTRVFQGHLPVVGSGGTLAANQSPVRWPNTRIDVMRSERKKYRQRDHCTRRNHEDCVLSHPANMRPE
jgi:hypothetical protein